MEMTIIQCSICKAAWPMANCKENQNSNYVCVVGAKKIKVLKKSVMKMA